MPSAKIEVHGLRELRRELRQAEGRTQKEVQQANKQAAEVVAAAAITRPPKGPHEGGGNVQPIWSSIKSRATTGRALVVFGGNRSPHAPAYEFGGTVGRFHSSARTHITQQAYVYPAIEATRPQQLERYERALNRITRDL